MTMHNTKSELLQRSSGFSPRDDWFDPVETRIRDRACEFLQAMFEGKLEETLARARATPAALVRRRGEQGHGEPGVW